MKPLIWLMVYLIDAMDKTTNEWVWVPLHILAPKDIMTQTIEPLLDKSAANGTGLFTNATDTKPFDEDDDALLGVDRYLLNCYISPFYREIDGFGIFDVLKFGDGSNACKKLLLRLLSECVNFAKDHTTEPNKIRNKIIDAVKALDQIPVWGLLLQILLLQGLSRWLTTISFEDNPQALNEAQSLYDWITLQLSDKILFFCFYYWSEDDKKRLQPICRYLMTTEIGREVQLCIREKYYSEPKPEPPVSTATDLAPELPPELNSDAFRTIISRAIEASLVSVLNGKYHWDGTKRLAAYFADKATAFLGISKMLIDNQPAANWKPFECLFGIANLSESKKYWIKTGLLPKGYEKVDALFNNLD